MLAEIGAAVSRAMPTREFVLREIGDGVHMVPSCHAILWALGDAVERCMPSSDDVLAVTIMRNWPSATAPRSVGGSRR